MSKKDKNRAIKPYSQNGKDKIRYEQIELEYFNNLNENIVYSNEYFRYHAMMNFFNNKRIESLYIQQTIARILITLNITFNIALNIFEQKLLSKSKTKQLFELLNDAESEDNQELYNQSIAILRDIIENDVKYNREY
jgi:hypothetical protein